MPRSFDLDKMELTLGGYVVKVYRFADDPEMPWFQAKPIVTFLGYKNITQTLEDNVYPEDQMSLKGLLDAKGVPLGGVISQITPPGYNELKAIHINEPALYSLIFGSRKEEAKAFKRWVCTAVLPCIRRKGFFGNISVSLKARDEELQLALKARDDQLCLTLNARDDAVMSALRERDTAQLDTARTSFLEAMSTRLTSMTMSLAGHLSSAVKAAVLEGIGLKKAQPKKKTTNAAEMPEDQRATPLQTGPLSLGLSTVALELFPEMSFAAWRKIRGSFGYHAKKERLRLHALGERHPEYVSMPLLWAYTGSASSVEGGGARYVYLPEHRGFLQRVFCAQLQTSRAQRNAGAPAPTESLEQRVHRLDSRLSPGERAVQWPVHVAELEPQWNDGQEDV
jgi:prophage antirepressor-like protein